MISPIYVQMLHRNHQIHFDAFPYAFSAFWKVKFPFRPHVPIQSLYDFIC